MKDKLEKRSRCKLDYKNLIKGQGLWDVFKKFCKSKNRKIKSKKRLMYCFCMKYLLKEINAAKAYLYDVEECIRIVHTPWLDED